MTVSDAVNGAVNGVRMMTVSTVDDGKRMLWMMYKWWLWLWMTVSDAVYEAMNDAQMMTVSAVDDGKRMLCMMCNGDCDCGWL
jgi:hypothetical protein